MIKYLEGKKKKGKGCRLLICFGLLFIANCPESDLVSTHLIFFSFRPLHCFNNNKRILDSISSPIFPVSGGDRLRIGAAEMVAVAAEVAIRGADAVPAAEREAVRAAAAEAAAKGGEGESGKEEVRYYASDIRKLEELFSKLNPSAEEFVPPSRRRVDGGARRLSADAPVFVSPAIDYYARHHQLPPPPLQQQQPMHVLQFVGGVGGGGMGGGGGRDSSSDGSVNGQPNRRVIIELPSPIRCGLSPGRGLQWAVSGSIDRSALDFFVMLMALDFWSLSRHRLGELIFWEGFRSRLVAI